MSLIEVLGWGFLLRASQALVMAAPYLLFGLLISGVLRVDPGIGRLLGRGTFTGPLRAWAVGLLLPICSFGALPVARQLRRSGVPTVTLVAFLLAAPLFHPLSLVFGITFLEPVSLLTFVLASAVTIIGTAIAWNRWFGPSTTIAAPEAPASGTVSGLNRMAAVVVHAASELTGPLLFDLLLGLTFVGVLGALIPFGALQFSMQNDNPWAPPLMAAIAAPLYVTAEKAVMLCGVMFEHSNSVPAAFVLVVLGTGMNAATVGWLGRTYGWRTTGSLLALLAGGTLVAGYVIGFALPQPPSNENHTHAFDDISCPYRQEVKLDCAAHYRNKPAETLQAPRLAALGILGILVTAGGVLRLRGDRVSVERLLSAKAADAIPTGVWNRPLPQGLLNTVIGLGAVGILAVGVYVYYPAPKELFRDMDIHKAEAIAAASSGSNDEALYQIHVLESLIQKLPTALLLREGSVSDQRREKTHDLAEALEGLHDAMEAAAGSEMRSSSEFHRLVNQLQESYTRCRSVYLGS